MTLSLRDRMFRRAGHVTFQSNDRIFIWGGYVEQIAKVSIQNE